MTQPTTTPQMSFAEAITASTANISQFRGRSRRSEYWWTMLLVLVASIVLTPLGGTLLYIATIPLKFRRLHDTGRSGWWYGANIIAKITFIASFIVDLYMTITSSRLFGWDEETYTTISFFIYWAGIIIFTAYEILLIIFFCTDSQPSPNKYGESPKYRPADVPPPPPAT